MKIDAFPHILPAKYRDLLHKKAKSGSFYLQSVNDATPGLWDLDVRFRIMDKYPGLKQILTLASPPVEDVVGSEDAVILSKVANDEMAALVDKHKDRFVAAVACLPMSDVDAALEETDRTIGKLHFKGVQLYTPTRDKALDSKEFMPLYEKMSAYDLPIWIHPKREIDTPDYKSENHSKYWIFSMFGWPYETTAAITRLVFSGILEKYPTLKFITHHCGGMVPYFADRMAGGQDYAEILLKAKFKKQLSKPPIEYFRMFYADTALYGATPSLMCGHAFFGTDHILFATDMPYDSENGDKYTRQTIAAVEKMDIPDRDKAKIFEDNVRTILNLKKD
jgi:predicted TIM-barrel fold metal-dependent hydrolase